jgi:hypothetical protein
MLSNTLPLNSSTCCGTTPIWLRRLASVTVAMSMPSIRMRPLAGRHQPHQQMRQGALARAVGARSRRRFLQRECAG